MSTREQSTDESEVVYKIGDRVKIHNSGGMLGRIIEFRGPLGPEGANIYRVRIRREPKGALIEVRENQLELLPETEE